MDIRDTFLDLVDQPSQALDQPLSRAGWWGPCPVLVAARQQGVLLQVQGGLVVQVVGHFVAHFEPAVLAVHLNREGRKEERKEKSQKRVLENKNYFASQTLDPSTKTNEGTAAK